MSGRNLTIVQMGGKYKVAQYGQGDGDPEYDGVIVLEFAQKLRVPSFRAEFERKLNHVSWITDEEYKARGIDDDDSSYPEFYRYTESRILDLIMEKEDGLKLYNQIEFATDTVFCEWVWVIDLDANTFEAYTGYHSETLTDEDRFFFLLKNDKDAVSAVKLVTKWELNNLPSEEEFMDFFYHEEEYEEDE